MENLAEAISGHLIPGEDIVDDEWTKLDTYGGLVGSHRFGVITPEKAQEHIGTLMALDSKHAGKARARVSQIVRDEETAKRLTPWYPTWCKRPTFSDTYLEAFNNDNVKLIDTDGKGIEKITPRSVIANGQEYPLDILVLSTGYRSPGAGGDPGSLNKVDISGRNGRHLADKWEEQGVSTLHGVLTNGFPNLLFHSLAQTAATANYGHVIEVLSEHIASIIAMAHQRLQGKKGNVVIEPSVEAEEAWGMAFAQGAAFFSALAVCTPSYVTLEGEALRMPDPSDHVAMMKKAKASIWSRGLVDFTRELENWRNDEKLKGLEVTVGS
jgi:cation diffusion facilitator CzcD-associated flavoprotein CzcO